MADQETNEPNKSDQDRSGSQSQHREEKEDSPRPPPEVTSGASFDGAGVPSSRNETTEQPTRSESSRDEEAPPAAPEVITSQPTNRSSSELIPNNAVVPSNGDRVIVSQPTANRSRTGSTRSDGGGPPGLGVFYDLNQIIVKQKIEIFQVLTGFNTNNQYVVLNNMGQRMFNAVEMTDCPTRFCCGTQRCFELTLMDNLGQRVLNIYRPLRCQAPCFPCCLQSIQVVSAIDGLILGYVVQNWTPWKPYLTVTDADDNAILHIYGPCCVFSCCGSDVDFEVYTSDGIYQIGRITKQWSGIAQEYFTAADNYVTTFPLDLDTHVKALLLGATLLIDYMYFEGRGNGNNRGGLLGVLCTSGGGGYQYQR